MSIISSRIFASTLGLLASGSALTYRVRTNRDKTHFILDIDHTLVHTIWDKYTEKGQQYEGYLGDSDFKIKFPENSGSVYKRRWTNLTLRALQFMGHVHAYTQGTENYALKIVKGLDPKGEIFEKVRGRKSCEPRGERIHCKDIAKIVTNPDEIQTTLLIDDRRRSFVQEDEINQEPNCIQVKPFYIDRGQDNTLLKIVGFVVMRKVFNVDDLSNGTDSRSIVK